MSVITTETLSHGLFGGVFAPVVPVTPGGPAEVKRKAELVIVEELAPLLSDLTVLPSRGGDDTEDAADVPLSFVVVEALEAKQTLARDGTYLVQMAAGYITDADDVTSPVHSSNFKRLMDAIEVIRRRVKGGAWSPAHSLTVHGLDVDATESFTDTERRAHGDTVSFVIGCTDGRVRGL